MTLLPFDFDGLRYRDVSTLNEARQERVALSLSDSMRILPVSGQCENLGIDSDGDYPIVRLAGIKDNGIVSSWWFGCNETTPESTEQDAIICSRPWPGHVNRQRFNAGKIFSFLKFLLDTKLDRDDGGTLQFEEIRYTFDPSEASTFFPEFSEIQAGIVSRGSQMRFDAAPDGEGRTRISMKKKLT